MLVVNGIGTKETGTASWELECLHSEGEVLIIRIMYQEAVVDVLLQTLGLIALRYKWASITRSQTFFNTGGLGESFVVSFNIIHNDSPFTLSVDGTKRSDVGSFRWTEIGLFLQSIGPLNREFSVEVGNISIEAPDLLEVIVYCSLNLILWVFFIFNAPCLGVVDGAGRFSWFFV